MGRSLSAGGSASRFLTIVLGAFCALWASSSWAGVVSSPSEFRGCLETALAQRDVECRFESEAIGRTTGTAEISTGVFSATLPTSRRFAAVLSFDDPEGCAVWEHAGQTLPDTSSTPVDVIQLRAPAGLKLGSTLRIVDPCVRNRREREREGSGQPATRGIVLTGDGAANLTVTVEGNRMDLSALGASSVDFAGITVPTETEVTRDSSGAVWYQDGDGAPYRVGTTWSRASTMPAGGLYLSAEGAHGLANAWTFAGWAKLTALPAAGTNNYFGYLRVVSNSGSVAVIALRGSSADTNSQNVLVSLYDSAGSLFKNIEYDTQFTDTDWHFYAVTFDGAATGDPVKLYVDGGEFPTDWRAAGSTDTTGTMADDASGRSIRMGGNNGSVNGLAGNMGPNAWFPTALTAAQIAALYNAGPAPCFECFGAAHVYRPCPLPAGVGTDAIADGSILAGVTLRNLTESGADPTCVTSAPVKPTNPIRGQTRLVAFGDSRVQAVGEPESETLFAFIPRDFVTNNQGVGGTTCVQMAATVAAAASSLTESVAVLQCGVNDASDANAAAWTSNGGARWVHSVIQGAVDDLVAEGLRVIVTTPIPVLSIASSAQPRKAKTDELARYMREHGFEGAELCDLNGGVYGYGTEADLENDVYESDGIHLVHREGDEIVGPMLAKCLGAPISF